MKLTIDVFLSSPGDAVAGAVGASGREFGVSALIGRSSLPTNTFEISHLRIQPGDCRRPLRALTRRLATRIIRGSSQTAYGTEPVANIKSAQKRARQAEKLRKHNMGLRSKMRTKIKNVQKALDAGDKDAAQAAYKEAVPVIDSMINKGIVNKNKAARHKSRLNARLKALAA
jgi:small subunit ribosomal protein S20